MRGAAALRGDGDVRLLGPHVFKAGFAGRIYEDLPEPAVPGSAVREVQRHCQHWLLLLCPDPGRLTLVREESNRTTYDDS